MLRDPSSIWNPVAFLDDDPSKRNLRHAGVAVRGTTQQMIPTARATDADVLVIATASIDADTIGALTTQAQEIGLRVRIVPQLHEMIDGRSEERRVGKERRCGGEEEQIAKGE